VGSQIKKNRGREREIGGAGRKLDINEAPRRIGNALGMLLQTVGIRRKIKKGLSVEKKKAEEDKANDAGRMTDRMGDSSDRANDEREKI